MVKVTDDGLSPQQCVHCKKNIEVSEGCSAFLTCGCVLCSKCEYCPHQASRKKPATRTRLYGLLDCPICLCDAEMPVATDCGHVFCAQCVISSSDDETCPTCKQRYRGLYPLRSTARRIIRQKERREADVQLSLPPSQLTSTTSTTEQPTNRLSRQQMDHRSRLSLQSALLGRAEQQLFATQQRRLVKEKQKLAEWGTDLAQQREILAAQKQELTSWEKGLAEREQKLTGQEQRAKQRQRQQTQRFKKEKEDLATRQQQFMMQRKNLEEQGAAFHNHMRQEQLRLENQQRELDEQVKVVERIVEVAAQLPCGCDKDPVVLS